MSLNASTTSVIINSLTSGGLYTARVAGMTRAGPGPFSNPTLLNMDPGQLTQHPPRSDPNHGNNSIVKETWFLVLMVMMVFSVIAALLGALYVKRRQAMSKQLGHLNVPVGTANDICQLNKDTLWLERGWRPTNSLQSAGDKDCETKLLNNHMIAPGIVSMANSEYAEVNLTTFYNTRKPSAPPEPYATTTLCVANRSPDSMETSGQKSSSSDSCVKPDYSSLESAQEHNKSTMSPSSDNASSVYTDENMDHQRRTGFRTQQQQQESQPQQLQTLPNWCDMLPPPPEHPPPPGNSLSNRMQQQSAAFSPHLGKRNANQNGLDCGSTTKSQSPPTPPVRVGGNNFSSSPTPWNGCSQNPHEANNQQARYTTLPPQTNPPPVPSFPQGFNHYDVYKAQENEYESGSLIYGHQNGIMTNEDFRAQDAFNARPQTNDEAFRLNGDMFRNDNLYQPENDEWDRKSCDSNTHSDMCCSCSESSCLYADTMEYNNQFAPSAVQLNPACANHTTNTRGSAGSRSRNNTSPRRRNRSSSPTYSTDSNYSCIPQRACPPVNSQDRLRHNRSKGNKTILIILLLH